MLFYFVVKIILLIFVLSITNNINIMAHNFKNTEKKRKATLNEIAKNLLDDAVFRTGEFLSEKSGLENLTDVEHNEIQRFLEIHTTAIRKKLNTYGTIQD